MSYYICGKLDGMKEVIKSLEVQLKQSQQDVECAKNEERQMGHYDDCGEFYRDQRIQAEARYRTLLKCKVSVENQRKQVRVSGDIEMEQRTCNIIMCCKGHCGWTCVHTFEGPYAMTLDAIAAYMGHECDYPQDKYSLEMIKGIMKTALADYFRVCDNPRFEIINLLEENTWKKDYTLVDRIATLFSGVQVRDGEGNYVNGFSEKLIRQSEIDIATPQVRTVEESAVSAD